MHLFQKFAKNTSAKEVFFTSFGIFFVIVILRSLGLLQSLELTSYDLLYFLRPAEPKDERIVIVDWSEKDIQILEEGTISDNTLAALLNKIKAGNPRAIGLDIFRDAPVTSKALSDEENQKAYQKLIEIFNSTPNLIGIEKALPDKVNPPLALKKQGQVAAADLLLDVDGKTRRAFLFPRVDAVNEAKPAGNPGLGFFLAIGYLYDEGFVLSRDEDINPSKIDEDTDPSKDEKSYTPVFSNPETKAEITLKPLKKLDGSYLEEEDGIKILVNWRKGRDQFSRFNVIDVVQDLLPPDIFEDKIVLIGNTSASTPDKHHLPLNRWTDDPLTNGVEVHAQIASSIISAVLDERPLIKPIPEWSEYLMLLISVSGIALIAKKYRQINSPLVLYLITTASAIGFNSFISALALIGFTQGYWIPIIPTLLGSSVTPLFICLIIYINKIKQNTNEIKQSHADNKILLEKVQQTNKEYKLLMKDLNHTIQNSLASIIRNGNFVQSFCSDLYDHRDNIPLVLEELEENLEKPPITTLKRHIDALMVQVLELNRQRENAQQYLNIAYSDKKLFSLQSVAFNDFIKQIVENIIPLKQSQYNLEIELQENYDPLIIEVNINPQGFEKVLENLIDNAYHALKAKAIAIPDHQARLLIETKKENNQIKVIVQDNGIGIATAKLDKIFLPFQSFRAESKTQGLGLSLAKETIALHNGKIKVETVEHEGSKFIVLVPLDILQI